MLLSALGLSSALALSGGVASAVPAQAAVPAAVPQSTQSTTLLTVDSTGTLWSYAAPGTSKLGARKNLGSGWKDAKQIISADWDDDNVLDIVARWGNGDITVSNGISKDSYRTARVVGSGFKNSDINITKLKRSDVFPGVIARNSVDGKLHYYSNRFGGRLETSSAVMGTGWATMNELSTVDFDRDGGMDLIARNRTGSLILYRTNGLGSFVSEGRKTIGSGWNPMSAITVKSDFAGRGTVGLLARNAKGNLYYYALTTNRINSGKHVGNGWNGYTLSDNAPSPAPTTTKGGAYEKAYTAVSYNYMKKWCPTARIILNHPSTQGDIYGMYWWGTNTIAMRTDIPESITKEIALHECGHMLQARAFGAYSQSAAISRMNAIYKTSGTVGIEENADCISAYLNPFAAPTQIAAASQAAHWASHCTGAKGDAAKLIVQGKRP